MRHAFLLLAAYAAFLSADQKPEWCRNLPRPAYSKLERVPVKDTWFEVYRIRPGVFAIYEPQQSEEVISYLVVGSKKALLFDTGMGISNIRAVVAELTKLPVAVLNSHTHNDHVGDNWRFSEIYGRDTAFTREHARGSREAAQAELAPGELCGPLPAGFDRKSYRTRPFTISHWLHGGEKIDLGGRVLQVISTPGHTPDSIMLFDEQNGLLFTGDMYYPGPIYLFRPETDLDAYVASMRRMAELAPRVQLLLPAHNLPIAEPGELSRVLAAMEQVRAGKIEAVPHGENWEYRFEGFSFLMQKQRH
ncbi:MAG TPA: MBL fold metallo-hydrolase [Terriglobales bacterium]|nr:MBL fold metallo-hydrolase [Terriglobales bacterium]